MVNNVIFNIKDEKHDFSDVMIHHIEDSNLQKMITDRSKDGYVEAF